MTPFAQLSALLQDMFSAAELRGCIRRLRNGKALADALPEGRCIALLAGDTVDVLKRRGRVDQELFAALVHCAPARHAEISSVARGWGVQEPNRPASAPASTPDAAPASGDMIFNGPVSIVGSQVGTGTMTQVTRAPTPPPVTAAVVAVHEPPGFATELAQVLREWNQKQAHIEFRGLNLPKRMERELLTIGAVSVHDAAAFANRVRAASGLQRRSAIVLFTEKRLFHEDFYRLFMGGTHREDEPPSTATISLEFPRYLQSIDARPGRPLLFQIVLHNLLSIVALGLGLESHHETRGCLLDFCGNMGDIVTAVERGPCFCERCRHLIDALEIPYLYELAAVVARQTIPDMLDGVEQRFYGREGQQNLSHGSQGLGNDRLPNAAKHTQLRTDPMPELPRDLIDLLAEEYPDIQSARALWKRAGGSNRQVENISKPGDLWQKLWLRTKRGASVRPAALLHAALAPDELPNNAVLIRHLRSFAPPNSALPAQRIVAAIETAPVDMGQEDTLEILAEWEVEDEVDSFAALCPALEGRIPAKRRGELRETLEAIAEEIRAGTLTGVVKAATSVAVKALLAGLAATT